MNGRHGIPPRPSGSGPEARFFQWVWDTLARSGVIAGRGIVAHRTTRGVVLESTARGGGGCGEYVEVTLCDQDTGETYVYELCGRLKSSE